VKPVAEIARELGVDAVVKGSVLRVEGNVRLQAQLIEAETERQRWDETYDRELRDILILQSEVARAIAHQAGVTVTPEEAERLARRRPVDPEAYEAYLRGEYLMVQASVENSRQAREHFQLAIAKDPTYAPAYLGLGETYATASVTPMPETKIRGAERQMALTSSYPSAKTAVTKALELDPNLSEAHRLLAEIYFEHDRNWVAAEEHFARALDLEPSDALTHESYGEFLSARGRHEEAIEHSRKAVRLDPASPDARAQLGHALYYAQRFDEALGQLEETHKQAPDLSSVHYGFGRVYLKLGQHDEAIAAFEKGDALAASGPSFLTAYAHAVAGHDEQARTILKIHETNYNAGNVDDADRIALIYIGLGDKDRAFEWLEKARQENDPSMEPVGVSPLADPLRDDARWQELMRKLGLRD
jgi:tetratricopeptide (TPR) repeat protein